MLGQTKSILFSLICPFSCSQDQAKTSEKKIFKKTTQSIDLACHITPPIIPRPAPSLRDLTIPYNISDLFRKNQILRTNRGVTNTFRFLENDNKTDIMQHKAILFDTLVKQYGMDPRLEMTRIRERYSIPNVTNWRKIRNRTLPEERMRRAISEIKRQKIWQFLSEFSANANQRNGISQGAYQMGRNLTLYRLMLMPENYLTCKLEQLKHDGGTVYDIGSGKCAALIDMRDNILPVNGRALHLHAVTLASDATTNVVTQCKAKNISLDLLEDTTQTISYKARADLIFDVYGQLTYDKDISQDLQAMCNALKVGGEAYIVTDAPATLIKDHGVAQSFHQWFLALVQAGEIRGLEILGIHSGENDCGQLMIRRCSEEAITIPALALKEYAFVADGAALRYFERC